MYNYMYVTQGKAMRTTANFKGVNTYGFMHVQCTCACIVAVEYYFPVSEHVTSTATQKEYCPKVDTLFCPVSTQHDFTCTFGIYPYTMYMYTMYVNLLCIGNV